MARRAEAANAYRVVDRATAKASDQAEPLWLPAGWLAVILLLTAAAPSFGSTDGWRARGAKSPATRSTSTAPRVWKTMSPVRPVAYEDDIAGPALRVAGRMRTGYGGDRFDGGYRVAQQDDGLRDAFSRPFGVDEPAVNGPDADEADRLFDDMPAEPEPDSLPEPEYGRDADYNDYADEEPTDRTHSLFDDEPAPQPRMLEPADDLADDLAMPFGRDRGERSADNERAEALQDCAEGLAELKAATLDTIDLNIGVTGDEGEDYPFSCSLDDGSIFAPRHWCDITYMWKASGLCHKPLYFEDVHLERYGHSWGPYVQPLVSGAHFFGTLPVLPYKMGLKTPTECVYTLGHYRPGSCAPYLLDPIPFTWRAAIFQAGATVGAAAILP